MHRILTDNYPEDHPMAQHARIAARQKELTEQYIREETFKLTPYEEKLLARGLANARKRARLACLQRKHDEVRRGSAR